MKDNSILKNMQIIYGTYEKDWMGFRIGKYNFLTYHHIVKRENDGLESIDNGALLGRNSHELLNMLECLNSDLYYSWNDLFKEINNKKRPISNDLWQKIYLLKKETLSFSHPKMPKRYKKR